MLSRPSILLHYYITVRCNCRCNFCSIWRQKGDGDARLADVESHLRQARKLGVRFVDLTGGEPLLHPDLAQMLRVAKACGLRTTLTTNGLLYPQRAAELAGLVDLLHFSLDGDAPTHDALRGQAVFDSVLESIDCARRLGETPDLLFTATAQTIGQLPAMVRLAQSLGLILIVNPVFLADDDSNLSEANLQFIESFYTTPYVYINRAFHLLRRSGGNDVRRPRCRAVSSTLVISADNRLLLPCYHCAELRLSLEQGLINAWRSCQRKRFLIRQGRAPYCAGCAINCYFDPSFLYKVDALFWSSLRCKWHYGWDKYLRRPIDRRRGRIDERPAAQIAADCFTR